MTIHQKCPYCDRLFEIGPKDYRPLRRHIAFIHSEGEGSAKNDCGAEQETVTDEAVV